MATLNRTRVGKRNQKGHISLAMATITPDDLLATGDLTELVEIPDGALVVGAELIVKTAFDAGTSITLTGRLDAATLFAAISVATTGVKSLTVTKADSGSGAKLGVLATVVGAMPTVGEAVLSVSYVEYNLGSGCLTNYSNTVDG